MVDVALIKANHPGEGMHHQSSQGAEGFKKNGNMVATVRCFIKY